MCMSDPISDMISRVRNALAVKKNSVIIPYSKIKFDILKLMLEQGYLRSVELSDRDIVVGLKYYSGSPVVATIKRISKPGCRVYYRVTDLKPVNGGLGISILSSSHGIISGSDAKEKKLGGELLMEVF